MPKKTEEKMPSPFDDKKEVVVNAPAEKKTEKKTESTSTDKETPTVVDYSKYASMAEAPAINERRKFDFVAMSGGVETEVITTKDGDVEKRKPAMAYKLLLTKERGADDRYISEELALPLKVVPIKYRMVMEQRSGAKGEILVLKTSEFNGNTSDIITVNRFSPDGKVVETMGPMTVFDARKKFVTNEGKMALRDKVHLYSLVNGGTDVVRFVVKGTGLWEMESELHKGKTEASQMKYPFLSRYISEFAMNDPYFLYEMEVNAVYRDHGSIKYYRPTFTKGARISAETEAIVIEHLEDLHKYFGEMDEATKKFVATAPVAQAEVTTDSDLPFEDDAPVMYDNQGEGEY